MASGFERLRFRLEWGVIIQPGTPPLDVVRKTKRRDARPAAAILYGLFPPVAYRSASAVTAPLSNSVVHNDGSTPSRIVKASATPMPTLSGQLLFTSLTVSASGGLKYITTVTRR